VLHASATSTRPLHRDIDGCNSRFGRSAIFYWRQSTVKHDLPFASEVQGDVLARPEAFERFMEPRPTDVSRDEQRKGNVLASSSMAFPDHS
jgi:hypothetical protein